MAENGNYNLDAMYEALKSFDNYTAPYEIEVTLELINSKIKNTESTINELKSRTFYQGNDIINNLSKKLKDAKNYVTDSLVPVSRDLYTLKRLLQKRNELKTKSKKTPIKNKPYYDYNEGFYDYLMQYYVGTEEIGVTDSAFMYSELESIEFAIIKLIDEIKYKTTWDKSAIPALPPIPTVTIAPLYGPPPSPSPTPPCPTIMPTQIPIPTVAPLYGPPIAIGQPAYGVQSPITVISQPAYGVQSPIIAVGQPAYGVQMPSELEVQPKYGVQTTTSLSAYEIEDKYDSLSSLRPMEDEYEIRPIGDKYEDLYSEEARLKTSVPQPLKKETKPIGCTYEDIYGKPQPSYLSTIPIADTYEDIYGKSPKTSIADFEDKPREIEIDLI